MSAESHSNAVVGNSKSTLSSVANATIQGETGGVHNGVMQQEIEKDEVVTFYDATDDEQNVGTITSMLFPFTDPVLSGVKEFLMRPVKIYSYQWGTGGTFDFTFNPWGLFLSDVAVSRKLANFYLLRSGGIKIRIMATGNPYTFGKYFIAYWPHSASDKSFTQTLSLPHTVKMSTLPAFCTIDPSANSVIDMLLPETIASTNTIVSTFDLGKILGTVGSALQTTSTLSPTVDISFYASFANPEVAFNTTRPPAYATSSEWKGKLSTPLSKVSDYANKIKGMPVIGQYATSVGMAAKLGAHIAKQFGYSKPIDVQQPNITIPRLIGNMTNSDGVDTTTSLTFNTHACASLDSQSIGLPGEDEMLILPLLKRPSLCKKLVWSSVDAIDYNIANLDNSPHLLYVYNVAMASGTWSPLTNLSYICGVFRAWRGTIKYKFDFCVSKYHTGRVRIVFEPFATTSSLDPSNVTKNWIVDLAEQTTIDIEVPFAYPYTFVEARVSNTASGVTDLLGTSALAAATAAGFLRIDVLTPLKCGSMPVTDIDILVYNCAGDDFEVARPTSLFLQDTGSIAISWLPYNAPTSLPAKFNYANWAASSESLSAFSYSEKVDSLRTLLKRYCYSHNIIDNVSSATTNYLGIRAIPDQPGYTPINIGGYYKDQTPFTYFTYFAPSFIGYRGGIRHKLIKNDSNKCKTKVVYGDLVSNNMGGSTSLAYQKRKIYGANIDGALNFVPRADGTLEYTIPNASQLRFRNSFDAINPTNRFPGVLLVHENNGADSIIVNYDVYQAVADDFSFFYYRGPPTAYTIDLNPAPG